MILASFISQLRANAPVFGGRVAGAAEFTRGLRDYNTSLPLPAAYVLPGPQEVEGNDTWGGLQQLVHYGVGIAVELDAQTDRRGQAPAMDLDAVQAQIFSSVLNFRIDDCHVARGAYFAGAHSLEVLDRARLWFQYNFTVDWQITDADGWQIDGVPIQSIELDGFHAPGAIGVPGMDPAFIAMVAGDPDKPMPPPTNGPWPTPTEAVRQFFFRFKRQR